MDEGRGVVDGTVEDYVWILADALFVAGRAPAGAIEEELLDDLTEHWQLLRDWVVFASLGRQGGDFTSWTVSRGATHWLARGDLPIRVYYG